MWHTVVACVFLSKIAILFYNLWCLTKMHILYYIFKLTVQQTNGNQVKYLSGPATVTVTKRRALKFLREGAQVG